MGADNELDRIQKIMSSESKECLLNQSIEAKISISKRLGDYYLLKTVINGTECGQFIILKDEISIHVGIMTIKINLSDIKLKMIKGNNYLEIKNYEIINKNVSDGAKLYEFKLPENINDLTKIESLEKRNISVILKAKEQDLIKDYSYSFYNHSKSKITVKYSREFDSKFENEKLYLFNGFNYYENKLIETNWSSIEEIEQNSNIEDNKFTSIIRNSKDNDIINIKGNIVGLIMEKFIVEIEEVTSKDKIKVQLNLDLIKKINPNSVCEFIRFKKIGNDQLCLTNLSDIYSNNETFVEITFLDYFDKDKYYNRVKVNDIVYEINAQKLLIKIDSEMEKNIFEQQFRYEKVIYENKNEIIEYYYEFNLEVNKGIINHFASFLKKEGGHTYQCYYHAKFKNNLPKEIKIKVNENETINLSNFENFGNILKSRITLINVIKQDFIKYDYTNKRKFRFNECEYFDLNEYKNLKLYYLIRDDNINNLYFKDYDMSKTVHNEMFAFDLSEKEDNNKKYMEINNEDILEINKLFELIIKDLLNPENEEKEISEKDSILSEVKKFISGKNLYEYLEDGLRKYIFRNSKKDYDLIKKLIYIYLYYHKSKRTVLQERYKKLLNLLNDIMAKIGTSDYLTRIKVLIYYYNYLIESRKKNDINIVNIYNDGKNFEYIIEPFNLFFKILDQQNEFSAFYKAIHQFNGKIKYDLLKNLRIYSGSIISLNDIKFELIKTINTFCFVDFDDINTNANFSLSSEIVTFCPISFTNYGDDITSTQSYTIFLFLIFHEVCGHMKTNINNITGSPSYHLDKDLNIIYLDMESNDSGFLFECILSGNIINCKAMFQNSSTKELFDIKYYIQDNFNDLRNKINKIGKSIIGNKFTYQNYNDKKRPIKVEVDKEKKTNKKEMDQLPKELLDTLSEVEQNLDEYNYHSLFPLFKIPEGMSLEVFQELLKDNPVYKKFKKLLPSKNKKY